MEERNRASEDLEAKSEDRGCRLAEEEQYMVGSSGSPEPLSSDIDWLRAVFESVLCGIIIIDPVRHTIVDMNPTAEKMFGDKRERVIGALCHRYICPAEAGKCPITDLKQEVDSSERILIRADGTHCPVIKSVVSTHLGMRTYLIESIIDITERKQTEQRLLRTQFAVDRARDATFWVTPDAQFVYVNETACNSLGYSREELLSMTVFDIDRQFPREKWAGQWERSRQVGSMTVETVHSTKDGRNFPVEVAMNFIDFGGEQYRCDFVRDLTERKQLESQLRQSQKMEAIGTLAGGIAHDFNNLLTVLVGYGALLKMKVDEDDPMRVYVDRILSTSQKAADLIQGLLAFSRQQRISLIPVKLNDVIRETEKLLIQLLPEDINLKILLSKEDITVLADVTQIEQVLFNLATNARDAMPNGGVLAIETGRVYMDSEFREAQESGRPGNYGVISVRDTGTGIDQATLTKIFDPFFTTKEVGKGTGLGLSTVYGIVRQHNGYVDVASEPGSGSVFTVYLPAAASPDIEETGSFPGASGGKETILVAEDNKDVRQFLGDILREYGYTVIEATDGEDAIRKFRRSERIDLMILDSVMPCKNGMEVYDEIKEFAAQTRVLFTSGYTKDVVIDKGIKEGESDFISKPLTAEELLRKVRSILDGKTGNP